MGIKNFYVTFQKDSNLKGKYAIVKCELHQDARIYADHFWGEKVYKVYSSTHGWNIKNDPKYSELKELIKNE